MTIASGQIIVFYLLGIIMFILGIEEEKTPKDYIYLGLSFLINMMAYYLSYNETEYVGTAYLPLVLTMFSIIYIIYKGFIYLQQKTNDNYPSGEEE